MKVRVGIWALDQAWTAASFRRTLYLRAARAQRAEIEADFGGPMEWERIDGRKKFAIGVTLPGGYRNEDREAQIQAAMIETMVLLERAFRPRIQSLRGVKPAAATERCFSRKGALTGQPLRVPVSGGSSTRATATPSALAWKAATAMRLAQAGAGQPAE